MVKVVLDPDRQEYIYTSVLEVYMCLTVLPTDVPHSFVGQGYGMASFCMMCLRVIQMIWCYLLTTA